MLYLYVMDLKYVSAPGECAVADQHWWWWVQAVWRSGETGISTHKSRCWCWFGLKHVKAINAEITDRLYIILLYYVNILSDFSIILNQIKQDVCASVTFHADWRLLQLSKLTAAFCLWPLLLPPALVHFPGEPRFLSNELGKEKKNIN